MVDPFAEFAFAYQFQDPTPAADGDWEIAVARCRFFNPDEGFDEIEPDWLDPEYIADSATLNIQPDIAYDPVTGDLYIISAAYDVSEGTSYLAVVKADRLGASTLYWNTPTAAQSGQHNSFHPRIDVGQVNFGDYQNNRWLVGIAYTGWDYEKGWHVRINYWATDDTSMNVYTARDFGWDDPVFGPYPAGVPSIDIGPPGSDHAAIAWIQAKSHDWANATVMYADTKPSTIQGKDQQIGYGRLHPSSTWGSVCSAFPSVAVHNYYDDYVSSISYLRATNYVSAKWMPTAVAAETYTDSMDVDFGSEITIPEAGSAEGRWDSGTTVEHYFGMTTALTVYDSSYWMVWSGFDSADAGGPTSVWGSYGFTQ